MNKVLFATTAFAALAIGGMASAQGITLFGNARLGLFFDEGRQDEADDFLEGDDDELFAISRVRFGVNMTGTTDSGITYGATIRADNAPSGAAFQQGAGSVFVSGGFGTLTYGDTDGADRFRTGDVASVGLTDIRDYHETPHLTNARGGLAELIQPDLVSPEATALRDIYGTTSSRPTVRYDFDLFGLGASLSTSGNLDDVAAGIGYATDFGAIAVEAGLGYARLEVAQTTQQVPDIDPLTGVQRVDPLTGEQLFTDISGTPGIEDGQDNIDQWSAALGAAYNEYGAKVTYTRINEELDFETLSLGLTAGFGAVGLSAFTEILLEDEALENRIQEDTIFGLGASYDLGGGAEVKTGLVRNFQDDIVADFGIKLAF